MYCCPREGSAVGNRPTVICRKDAVEHLGYGLGVLVGGDLITLFGFIKTIRNPPFILLMAAAAFSVFAVQKKQR